MGFKTNTDDEDAVSDINVTPLVDVMLVLVIILLVTAPLLTQSVNVALPRTTSTMPDTQKQPLQIGVDSSGGVTLNKKPYDDLAILENELRNQITLNPDTAVHIWADQDVKYGKVAEVMAIVQHTGITKMSFVTMEK